MSQVAYDAAVSVHENLIWSGSQNHENLSNCQQLWWNETAELGLILHCMKKKPFKFGMWETYTFQEAFWTRQFSFGTHLQLVLSLWQLTPRLRKEETFTSVECAFGSLL